MPGADLLLELSRDENEDVCRMAAYLMRSAEGNRVPLRLLEMLDAPSGFVRRLACESLVRANRSVPYEYVETLSRSNDRFKAWSARMLLSFGHPDKWQEAVLVSNNVCTFIQAATALMVAWPSQERTHKVVYRFVQFIKGDLNDVDFNDLIRLLQLTLLRGALNAIDLPELATVVSEEFPADHDVMNRELIRLLVLLQAPSVKDRYLAYLESGILDSERIHMALHL